MSKPKVNKTTIKSFTSTDFKEAKKSYEDFIKRESNKVRCAGNAVIAFYFDDDEDTYKVTLIGGFGDKIVKELYSWDELSTFIYENI